jgi:GNAT superfamily N-acetyltransferase
MHDQNGISQLAGIGDLAKIRATPLRSKAAGFKVAPLPMSILYRPAAEQDLEPAAQVVKEALNHLEHRFGFEGIEGNLEITFPRFCLAEDSAGLWIAEDDGEIIGFGFSWTAEALWFLAQLFVRPGRQSSGIGGELLACTLRQAKNSGTSIRALITFSYNRVSLGLYMRHGLYPRIPLYAIAGRPNDLAANGPGLETWRLGESEDGCMLQTIDRSVLGITRTRHHLFSRGDPSLEAFGLKDRSGASAGYVYISNDGQIGPIAVTHAELMAPALNSACRLAADRGVENVSVFFPGMCNEALRMCLDAGFHLGRTMVLLSSKPFGDWTRYAPREPGFM